MIWLTSNYWTTWRSTTWRTRTFEGLRGARMFHLVSLSLQISLTFAWLSPWPVCVGCCCCLFGWVGFWFLSLGKFVFNHKLTPVVDRPSLALVRQCRKKKKRPPDWPSCDGPLIRTPIPISASDRTSPAIPLVDAAAAGSHPCAQRASLAAQSVRVISLLILHGHSSCPAIYHLHFLTSHFHPSTSLHPLVSSLRLGNTNLIPP